MSLCVYFLSARVPLTKTFTRLPDGTLDVTPYPMVSRVTSHAVRVDTLDDLLVALVAHAQAGHAFYKGLLVQPLVDESRRGLTRTDAPTEVLLLDFDGLPQASVDEVLETLGLSETSYILQWSASQGLKPGLRCHVWMLLDTPHAPAHLKRWLKAANFVLAPDGLALTASQVALRWPLDISTCQNDKLIYIAPPRFLGGLADPLPDGRIQRVIRERERVALPTLPTLAGIERLERGRINQLRRDSGLAALSAYRLEPHHSARYKSAVLRHPEVVRITGIQHARGYTYYNFNGGDSWGYYHAETRPEVVHNFKGEPSYLLREIAPEHYPVALARARERQRQAALATPWPALDPDTPQYWVINDLDRSTYHKVCFDPAQNTLQLYPASSLKQVRDFCLLHGLPVPDPVPDWRIRFDPSHPWRVDPQQRLINLYEPTRYRLFTGQPDPAQAAPIRALLRHVVGGDEAFLDYVENWLAYKWQTGKKVGIALILHGVPGTGKGLINQILRALFGRQLYTTTMAFLGEPYNAPLRAIQLLWVDEADIDSIQATRVEPKLKNWITEDRIVIREMRQNACEEPNHFDLILASNQHNSALVQLDDRRFSVAPRQEQPLHPTPEFIARVLDEATVLAYAAYLRDYPVREEWLRVPFDNAARRLIQNVTVSLPDEIVHALKTGNLEYFISQLPADSDLQHQLELVRYRKLIAWLYDKTADKLGRKVHVGLTKDELQLLFQYLAGWDQSPAKFNKALSRYGLHLTGSRIRRGVETFVGLYFDVVLTPEAETLYRSLEPAWSPQNQRTVIPLRRHRPPADDPDTPHDEEVTP